MLIRNEFAIVEVSLDESANGPRLQIRDVRTGTSIWMDALELEALTRLRHEDMTQILCSPPGHEQQRQRERQS